MECGYTTLRDYVAKLRKNTPHAYMVLHSLPGEEAQVDFGYIGTLKVNGRLRKAWFFIMSLSYSRYMYAAITLDQSVETFIRCHTEAFHYFGGVPQTVKIDNLKAAIVEAGFYEPTVQAIRRTCGHSLAWGTRWTGLAGRSGQQWLAVLTARMDCVGFLREDIKRYGLGMNEGCSWRVGCCGRPLFFVENCGKI